MKILDFLYRSSCIYIKKNLACSIYIYDTRSYNVYNRKGASERKLVLLGELTKRWDVRSLLWLVICVLNHYNFVGTNASPHKMADYAHLVIHIRILNFVLCTYEFIPLLYNYSCYIVLCILGLLYNTPSTSSADDYYCVRVEIHDDSS